MASRQFGRLRLSPVIKWAQLAPHIKKLRLRYDPAHAGARGLKEFKRQAHGPKIRRKFPKLSIRWEMDEDMCDPFCQVTYHDGKVHHIAADGKCVEVIYMEINEYVGELDRVAMVPEYTMQWEPEPPPKDEDLNLSEPTWIVQKDP